MAFQNILSLLTMARSTKASALVGLVAAALVMGLQYYGVPLSLDQAVMIVGAITAVTAHLVPDSAKQEVDALAKRLNMSADDLMQRVPEIEAVYPSGKNGQLETTPPAQTNITPKG